MQTVRKPVLLFKGKRENPRHDRCISLTLISGMEMEHFILETIPRTRRCLGAVSMDLQRKKFLVGLTALSSEVTGRVDVVGDIV